MQDAGSMILEQQPMKTAESIILFLQGQGHFPALSILQMSQKRARAVKSQAEIFGKRSWKTNLSLFRKIGKIFARHLSPFKNRFFHLLSISQHAFANYRHLQSPAPPFWPAGSSPNPDQNLWLKSFRCESKLSSAATFRLKFSEE